MRLLLVIVCLAFASSAFAQTPPRRFHYSTVNVLRGNPIGLISENTVGVRFRLVEPDELLFRETYVGLAIVPTFSPSFLRLGVLAEIQPAAVIRLWARADVFSYFGAFNFFQSFASPTDDYSDTVLDTLDELPARDDKRPYATAGSQFTLGLDLQFKVGPIAARTLSRMVRSDFAMRTGDRVFYDPIYDTAAPNHGWLFANDTDVLWLSDFGLTAGVRANTTAPLYEPSHFRPGEALASENGPAFRAGPLLAFTFFDEPGARFNKPTILATAQWHLAHRYRTGADVSQLIPYAFIGFVAVGDLLDR